MSRARGEVQLLSNDKDGVAALVGRGPGRLPVTVRFEPGLGGWWCGCTEFSERGECWHLGAVRVALDGGGHLSEHQRDCVFGSIR